VASGNCLAALIVGASSFVVNPLTGCAATDAPRGACRARVDRVFNVAVNVKDGEYHRAAQLRLAAYLASRNVVRGSHCPISRHTSSMDPSKGSSQHIARGETMQIAIVAFGHMLQIKFERHEDDNDTPQVVSLDGPEFDLADDDESRPVVGFRM
jgi:hypothetical protein